MMLGQIRHLATVLTDLYDGRIQTVHPMGAWITEKAERLATAAKQLAESESPPPVPSRVPGSWISKSEDPWITYAKECPYCGKPALRVGRNDGQRVEVECDNPGCDAREVVVLVTRDGHVGLAHLRPDVRALKAT